MVAPKMVPNVRQIHMSQNEIFFENRPFFSTQMTSQSPSIAILPHFPVIDPNTKI